MSLIRYPGSKAKLAPQIFAAFPDEMKHSLWMSAHKWEYREPFFGAGAIGFCLLRELPPRGNDVWINDRDPGMAALWTAVKDYRDELMELVHKFKPSPEYFYKFKSEDGRTDIPVVRQALRKLALHRMSYSGLGAMSGGPLGGANQRSEYNVDCRWNPPTIRAEIKRLNRTLSRYDSLTITCRDFADVIAGASDKTFLYLDPPYYEKGPALYKYSMSHDDHERLAAMLGSTSAHWLLSYDDHPEIRRLYSWAKFQDLHLTYTMGRARTEKRPKNREVLISPSRELATT